MANNLDGAIPKIVARGLQVLRKRAIMPLLINNDFSADAVKKGAPITIDVTKKMGEADDVTPSAVAPEPDDIENDGVTLYLNRWKHKSFQLSDDELQQIADESLYPRQLDAAADSIAQAMNNDILRLYKKINQFAGTAGQTPFQRASDPTNNYQGLNAARDARKLLNKSSCPQTERQIVLDVDAEANASSLPDFTKANEAGTDLTIREGAIGRKIGFDWFFNEDMISHTKTAAGTITTSGSGNTAGVEVLTVTGCTTAPAEGELFTIAGDSQQYVVGASATTTSWPISPPLAKTAANTTAITIVNSHVINLAFHRDAFAIAVRTMQDVDPVGNRIEVMQDNVTGMPLRLEIVRQNKRTLFDLDILYGVQLVRPECAVRILG